MNSEVSPITTSIQPGDLVQDVHVPLNRVLAGEFDSPRCRVLAAKVQELEDQLRLSRQREIKYKGQIVELQRVINNIQRDSDVYQ